MDAVALERRRLRVQQAASASGRLVSEHDTPDAESSRTLGALLLMIVR